MALVIIVGLLIVYFASASCSLQENKYTNLYIKFDPTNLGTIEYRYNADEDYMVGINGEDIFLDYIGNGDTFSMELRSPDVRIDYFYFNGFDNDGSMLREIPYVRNSQHHISIIDQPLLDDPSYEIVISQQNWE